MSAAETGQMSSAETRQMSTSKTGRCPVSLFYIYLVSAEEICLVSKANICPVSATDICPVSTPDICPVSTEDIYPVSTEDVLGGDENDFDPFLFTENVQNGIHPAVPGGARRSPAKPDGMVAETLKRNPTNHARWPGLRQLNKLLQIMRG